MLSFYRPPSFHLQTQEKHQMREKQTERREMPVLLFALGGKLVYLKRTNTTNYLFQHHFFFHLPSAF